MSVDYLFFGIDSVVVLLVVFILLVGVRDRAVLWFAASFGLYYLGTLERRHILHDLGVNSQLLEQIAVVLLITMPIALISLVASIYRRPVGKVGRVAPIVMLLGAVSVPANGIPVLEWWRVESNLVVHLAMTVGLLLILFWALNAVWQRRTSGIPLLVGLGALADMVISDIVAVTNFTEAYFGFRQVEVGVFALLLSLGYAVSQHVFETEKALQLANANALKAHEAERSRLARDIHDGIGQRLSTIKLRLQMLQTNPETGASGRADKIGELVGDVTEAIEDTRRIAHDLSPVLLEEHGLLVAMQSHAGRVGNAEKVAIEINAPEELRLPDGTRDHLYRIFQEAIRNAIDLGDGTSIDVVVCQIAGSVLLSVSDYGVGLNADDPETLNGATLGLKSMAERTRLLNGTLEISGKHRTGTTISLTVPVS